MAGFSVNTWESDLIDLLAGSLNRPSSSSMDISANLCFIDSLRDRICEPELVLRYGKYVTASERLGIGESTT